MRTNRESEDLPENLRVILVDRGCTDYFQDEKGNPGSMFSIRDFFCTAPTKETY